MKFQHLQSANSADVIFRWGERLINDLNRAAGKEPPIGSMLFWPVATPPLGWLKCDGATVNTDDYKELFIALGHTTGTTFTVPNVTSPIAQQIIIRAL